LTRPLQVVLVDEYQDTNLLQESLYFELARACGGALTVVGDDDQSLYRFRGATVLLFRDFALRYRKVFKRPVATVFLKTNYRSTKNIISFTNRYVKLDDDFQGQRVAKKPALGTPRGAAVGLPVLAMFRDSREELAVELADLIRSVFRGKGYRLPSGETIHKASEGGDVGDCALLCSSPLEETYDGRPRLPSLLRDSLRSPKQKTKRIEVFNPRGQILVNVPVVQQFGGMLHRCIDPNGRVTASEDSRLPGDVREVLWEWREAARNVEGRPGLEAYVRSWEKRQAPQGHAWPRSVSALELLYGLVHFLPELHDDPEGQVYMEVFTSQLAACQTVGTYGGDIVTDARDEKRSWSAARELLRDFLGPIASGTAKVNEDLMELFPRERLSILSIHQAKGLEFPFVIVDVGSDFKTNHPKQRFKRFPDEGGAAHAFEDLLWPHTSLGAPDRSARDRAFDDLYRQYFVAFSRPQQVLLLVGLTASMPGGHIPNVATGYKRTSTCAWNPKPFVLV
jgi:DNA helicase-2/ATP-dependent DNA helicase PcrA